MHLFKPKFKNRDGTYGESTNWAVKFRYKGKSIVKSTGTPNKSLAKQRAQAILNESDEKGWNIVKQKLPGAKGVSVETIMKLYPEFATHGKTRPLARNTYKFNLRQLAKIAQECHATYVHDISARAFLASDWGKSLSEASRATVCRSVSSIFSADARAFYAEHGVNVDNPISDRAKWRARPPQGFRAPSREFVQNLIKTANSELLDIHPRAWCVFTLALYAGLRQGEATHVRWCDLSENAIDVRSTEEHHTKNYTSRLVPVPERLIASLKTVRGNASDTSKLAGDGDKQVRFLATWLRNQKVEDAKPIHYLRKLYGSLVATEHGLFTAKEYLGHSSVKVTEGYYADLLDKKAVDWGVGN